MCIRDSPENNPILRFLDTRGLSDVEKYNPKSDIESARQQAHLIMVVVRVNDLALEDILEPLKEARQIYPKWQMIVVQSTLHNCYQRRDKHALPYLFNGTDEDFNLPGIPNDLRTAMKAQRRLFLNIPGKKPPVFVPLDFTTPEQMLPPSDYGQERLWSVLSSVLPDVVDELNKNAEDLSLIHI